MENFSSAYHYRWLISSPHSASSIYPFTLSNANPGNSGPRTKKSMIARKGLTVAKESRAVITFALEAAKVVREATNANAVEVG